MRVITGTARGCRLETLAGDATRPTTDKVKEAVFSAIQFDLPYKKVLDLFAGSGQLGIEALSRGAKYGVFVDQSKKAVDIIRRNLQTTRLTDKAQVVTADALGFLARTSETFDVVFLDPPYASPLLIPALETVTEKLNAGGVVVCESDDGTVLPETVGAVSIYRTYQYGRIHITVYR
ncbi:MAG: 16S rRNA (guanine(966)-N(2))-methyltransferase RsmD [Clostridia bacterium]|nr:16S rRNA (guanine(966)-N(2))-methyltransferase RsmD [Clostridia bacterium]